MTIPRVCVLALLLAVAAVPTAGLQEDAYWTLKSLNGRWWKIAGVEQKLAYISGIEDGVAACDEGHGAALMVKGVMYGEIIEQIDKLFEDSANRRIPVAMMLRVARGRMEGGAADDIERRVQLLRLIYKE